ncbi:MAG: hypothetical protein QE263_03245 [Vampirovibrionales bacterium]|nr:hypothetical protein [Vampirovibrionales bacterium]
MKRNQAVQKKPLPKPGTVQFGWGWNQHEQINEILYKALPKDHPLKAFIKANHTAIQIVCEAEDSNRLRHFIHLDDIDYLENPRSLSYAAGDITWKSVEKKFKNSQKKVMEAALKNDLGLWSQRIWGSPKNVLGLLAYYRQQLLEALTQTPQNKETIVKWVGKIMHLVDAGQPFHLTRDYSWPVPLHNGSIVDLHKWIEKLPICGAIAKERLIKSTASWIEKHRNEESLKPVAEKVAAKNYLRLFDMFKLIKPKRQNSDSTFTNRGVTELEGWQGDIQELLQKSVVETAGLIGVVLLRAFESAPLDPEMLKALPTERSIKQKATLALNA